VAVNSGSTAQVVEPDLKAGAAMFNVVDNLLLPPDELSSVSATCSAGCFMLAVQVSNNALLPDD
jgi:hypothetical protein